MNILEEIDWLPAGKTQLMEGGPAAFIVQDFGAEDELLHLKAFSTLDAARQYYVDLLFELRQKGCEPIEVE